MGTSALHFPSHCSVLGKAPVFCLPIDSHTETVLGTHLYLLPCSVPQPELSLYSEISSKGADLEKLNACKWLQTISELASVDSV